MISDEAIAEIQWHEHVQACRDVVDPIDQAFDELVKKSRNFRVYLTDDDITRLIGLARIGLLAEKRQALEEAGLL